VIVVQALDAIRKSKSGKFALAMIVSCPRPVVVRASVKAPRPDAGPLHYARIELPLAIFPHGGGLVVRAGH
jgi:hypothetical protein